MSQNWSKSGLIQTVLPVPKYITCADDPCVMVKRHKMYENISLDTGAHVDVKGAKRAAKARQGCRVF